MNALAPAPAAWRCIGRRGSGLRRPECVVANRSGQVIVPDWTGAVTLLDAQGQRRIPVQMPAGAPALHPNSVALAPDGSLLVAHMGEHTGGVWRVHGDGRAEPFLLALQGRALPPTNFVMVDDEASTWITVSTRAVPRWPARHPDVADGFVVRVDAHGHADVIADNLGFANELRISPDGSALVVVETFGRRLSRYALRAGGRLGGRSVLCEFGQGTWPDGLAFDAEGGIWVASAFSNRLLRVDRHGHCETRVDGGDRAFVQSLEQRFQAGRLTAPGVIAVPPSELGNCSSLAFCGDRLDRLLVGCLDNDSLLELSTDIPGAPPPHWDWHFKTTEGLVT